MCEKEAYIYYRRVVVLIIVWTVVLVSVLIAGFVL